MEAAPDTTGPQPAGPAHPGPRAAAPGPTELRVDLSSPVPVYEQIRSQVVGLVAVGALGAGDRLPASRDLARDLGIAVGTVQRAYRELEAGGTVVSRRRVGTVIAPAGLRGAAPEAGTASSGGEDLLARTRDLVRRARAEGLGDEAVLDMVRGALRTERT
ncbi:GntR family transcriptional regulator [Myceligenerans sp. TRM 65318]|uniref:GntR family transcriptional regulator n=1 Tax=Myceligenerans pegani TaxID=2776917 RepID=A0ABR9MZR0_9MICO|nr:GntR family transcriptional regulator [Myceligenerans sp. TRM 65318]MBE3019143.1 GntR family transcriptional regulator [Myceligenerans sp. TRM 65318]